MTWDLWIDFHQRNAEGLTPALAEYARPGIELRPGAFVIVGSEDSELAVAEIIEIRPDGVVMTRVLPGPAREHLHLLTESPSARTS